MSDIKGLPTEGEILKAQERFLAHMTFLSDTSEIKFSDAEVVVPSGSEHLEGALLDVLVGFVCDRKDKAEAETDSFSSF